MPLPTPRETETESDFVGRCMSSDDVKEVGDDQEQRIAICFSQWRKNNENRLKVNAQASSGELFIYEDIGDGFFGGITAKDISKELKAAGKINELFVRLNSVGGNVFEGVAIYNLLKRHPAKKTVTIDGIAASIASVIAMAGDHVEMAENGSFMIHDPWTLAGGNAEDLRKQADELDHIKGSLVTTYKAKTELSEDKISDFMIKETWFNAEEALQHGFIDSVTDAQAIAAHGNKQIIAKFQHIPERTKRLIADDNEIKQQSAATHKRLAEMQKFYAQRSW